MFIGLWMSGLGGDELDLEAGGEAESLLFLLGGEGVGGADVFGKGVGGGGVGRARRRAGG